MRRFFLAGSEAAVEGAGAGVGDGVDGAVSAGGEADGDGDDNKTYCFCDGVSYGEMIACDDLGCEREWVRLLCAYVMCYKDGLMVASIQFHIACVGLTDVPQGQWLCSRCIERRQSQKKTSRSGKKRNGGGRANARTHVS